MVDRARITFIKWLMRNYSSWASIHLFFVEFVVPSVVHLAPFPPTEKTISVWIWEQLSHWLPYSQIVCRVLDDSEDLKIWRLQISVAPVVLHFVLHCGKGVAQLGLEGLRRKVSLADYGNSSSQWQRVTRPNQTQRRALPVSGAQKNSEKLCLWLLDKKLVSPVNANNLPRSCMCLAIFKGHLFSSFDSATSVHNQHTRQALLLLSSTMIQFHCKSE